MIQIIITLVIGVVIGRFLRGSLALRYVGKGTLAGVAGLLFVMGAQIGSDPQVLANLPRLGGKAFVLAVLSIVGAVAASLPLNERSKV